MELKIYPRLCRESQLCIRRTRWRYGWMYVYQPRSHLVKRLAKQLGMTEQSIREQIKQERKWLIDNPWYS